MLDVYCDGGCNNVTRSGAYGSFAIMLSDDMFLKIRYELPECHTSNEAEYQILIELLKSCIDKNHTEIRIHSDSKLVVNQVNGQWRVDKETLLQRNKLAKELKKQFKHFELIWVPRKEIVAVLGH